MKKIEEEIMKLRVRTEQMNEHEVTTTKDQGQN